MQTLDVSDECNGDLVWWNTGASKWRRAPITGRTDQQRMRRIPKNNILMQAIVPLIKNAAGIGLLLLVIGVSDFSAIAAEPGSEPKADVENSTAAAVDYQEIADIFKKINGKFVYTTEQVKSLKRASLSQSKITDKDLEKLAQIQGNILLWNLGRCHNLTRASIPVIKRLTSARAIDLADTKLFNDYDEIVDAFKDYKNLEFLSVHLDLEGKEPTEKYKEFLKARPQLIALVGRYSQKVEGGYRSEHKEALHAACKRWFDQGLITQEEYSKAFK